jgi:hypothetical protein
MHEQSHGSRGTTSSFALAAPSALGRVKPCDGGGSSAHAAGMLSCNESREDHPGKCSASRRRKQPTGARLVMLRTGRAVTRGDPPEQPLASNGPSNGQGVMRRDMASRRVVRVRYDMDNRHRMACAGDCREDRGASARKAVGVMSPLQHSPLVDARKHPHALAPQISGAAPRIAVRYVRASSSYG